MNEEAREEIHNVKQTNKKNPPPLPHKAKSKQKQAKEAVSVQKGTRVV